MSNFEVIGGHPLRGRLRMPGDKSISHRAVMLAAVAHGESHVSGLSDGDDVARTTAAMQTLGATIEDGRITGVAGRGGLRSPTGQEGHLDLGNSGTTMRLLAGLVASHNLEAILSGDDSLSRRPMDRIASPLRQMGATVEGAGERCLPPLHIVGSDLQGIDHTTEIASAQVKSCILLAGLRAGGVTVVREPVVTRRHTEELLELCGAHIEESFGSGQQGHEGGHVVSVRASELSPFALAVPGDPSQAAFWLVAACIVAGSEVVVEDIYCGKERRGVIDVLLRMGADIDEVESDPSLPASAGTGAVLGPRCDMRARFGELHATELDACEVTGLDEIPVLAVAAACAEGTSVFHDLGELRVKESDRLAGIVDLLSSFGGAARVEGDDLVIEGAFAASRGAPNGAPFHAAPLHAAPFDSRGDHRMAMAAAIAGLAAGEAGTTRITGWDAVATSYRGFESDLLALVGGRR